MRRLRRRPLLAPVLLALLAAAAASPARAQAAGEASGTGDGPEVIILVRHAETAPDGTRDPALSDGGVARADRLTALLSDAGLTDVHSTAYRRTRGTAAPVADAAGLQVVTYDPRALPAFAESLLTRPGRHLVVGHSNTTPALVGLLGGDAGPPIDEDEHGRIYVLVPVPGGMRTVILRY